MSLKKHCVNLNDYIKNKKQILIGRQKVISHIIQILCKMEKPCPILIGEAGVGKTAIIKYLAQMINKDNVVSKIKDYQIYLFNIHQMMAGASYKGELEEKIESVFKDAISKKNVVLFIDEIHTIVQAENNIADVIKQYISNDSVKIIGATTLKEYCIIEKDKALKRRFTPVYVEEPTQEENISILRGYKEKIENYYNIKIYDKSLVFITSITKKFFYDLYEPDISLNILEETASRISFELNSEPIELINLKQKINILSLEIESKKLDNNPNIESLLEEKKTLEQQCKEKKDKWEKIQNLILSIQNNKNYIENLKNEAEINTSKNNYELAGKILYYEIPKIQNIILEKENEIKDYGISINIYITKLEILKTISQKTGIHLNSLNHLMDIQDLNNFLNQHIKGQEQAILKLCQTIEIALSGFLNEDKPIASFLLLGKTGVGKTETAKKISEYIFGHKDKILIFDMGQYNEEYSLSTLIGSPAGYIGHDNDGLLTGAVKNRPYQIIVFDEIEKAHSKIYDLFLAILDSGVIKDRKNQTISFKNTYIMFTSNIQIPEQQEGESEDSYKNNINKILIKTFRPEFIGRLDNIVKFNDLNKDMIYQIIQLNIKQYTDNFYKIHKITIEYNQQVIEYVYNKSNNSLYGAREVKQTIKQIILIPIIKHIKQNKKISNICLTIKNNTLLIQ
ncbi:Chaperone protein ClpB [bacterium AB1]|nr:Chaperone protein ClpB [bacterium AB1]